MIQRRIRARPRWPSGSATWSGRRAPSGWSRIAGSRSRSSACCRARSAATCGVSAPATAPFPAIWCCRAGAVRPLTLFKALQLHHCREMEDPFQDYVAFDLETTDREIADCEIVEIAAVRVRSRVVVEQFHRLVRPGPADQPEGERGPRLPRRGPLRRAGGSSRSGPSSAPSWATTCWWRTTGRSSTCRCSAGSPRGCRAWRPWSSTTPCRSPAHCWTRARSWSTWRSASAWTRAARTTRSTTPAALAGVMRHLGALKLARARRCALVQLLGWLGLAMALDEEGEPTGEERLLRELVSAGHGRPLRGLPPGVRRGAGGRGRAMPWKR